MNSASPRTGDTPVVTVTMLGTPASGKTSFMIGMYGAMSTGVDGFAVYADSVADPEKAFKDKVNLLNHWGRLLSDGVYPPPNDVRGFKYYEFVVNHGRQKMVRIDWLDYRGGAVYDALMPEDSKILISRLEASDSVYIALDGSLLGKWIAEVLNGGGQRTAVVQQELGLNIVANHLLPAVNKREEQGLRQPSLVLLVTKEDQLVKASGLSRTRALQVVEAKLRELLQVFYDQGFTVLVNPTTLAAVGEGKEARCFRNPFLFTFVEFLRNSIGAEQDLLDAAETDTAKTKEQMAILSRRLGGAGRILHWIEIQRKGAELRQIVEDAQRRKAALEAMRRQASNLEGELTDLSIYDSGHPRRGR